jgi:hypothetical protein
VSPLPDTTSPRTSTRFDIDSLHGNSSSVLKSENLRTFPSGKAQMTGAALSCRFWYLLVIYITHRSKENPARNFVNFL